MKGDTREPAFIGMVEAAPDALILVDGEGRIVHANPETERLFGYGLDELIDQPVELLLPERYRRGHARHREHYQAAPQTRGMGSGLELWARRKDGSEFPAEISLGPLITDDGLLTTAAIRDMTQQRAAAAALKLAHDELEAFSYSVAHDLRAPLRRIDGFARMLLDQHGQSLDAEGRDCLDEIQKGSQEGLSLIDALLSLARVTRAEIRAARVDLSAAAWSILSGLRQTQPGRSVEIVVQEGLSAVVDPVLSRALLLNLLGNAWKFTAQKPDARIELSALSDDPNTFLVRDNGAGFDMASAARLFVPFQRLHKQSDFEGTGIGLATAKRIVARHGGRIWAEAAPNAGATFYFTLPEGRSLASAPDA